MTIEQIFPQTGYDCLMGRIEDADAGTIARECQRYLDGLVGEARRIVASGRLPGLRATVDAIAEVYCKPPFHGCNYGGVRVLVCELAECIRTRPPSRAPGVSYLLPLLPYDEGERLLEDRSSGRLRDGLDRVIAKYSGRVSA